MHLAKMKRKLILKSPRFVYVCANHNLPQFDVRSDIPAHDLTLTLNPQSPEVGARDVCVGLAETCHENTELPGTTGQP